MRLTLLLIAALAARAALAAELEAPKPPAVVAAGAPEAGPAAAAAVSAVAPAGGVAGAAESREDASAADEAYGAAWAAHAFDGSDTPRTGRESAADGDGERAGLALSEAARRMTAGLDRYTAVREAEKAAALAQRHDGLVPAIGVRLKRAPDGPSVLSLTPGWPAEAAGLRPGDVLLTVNDQAASSGAVARALARAPEEPVRLEVRRSGDPRRLFFLVRGRKTRRPQVSAWLIGDAGYVKVARFAHGAAADAANAFYELKAKGAKRFVLDLRGNPGGFVEEETKLASLLLPDGALIQTAVTRHGRIETRTRDVAGFIDAPLAVLVDEKSASASESVAGALQDHRRAVVVGLPTHGKGLMQRIHRLDDGSTVTITEGRWHTPAGRHFTLGRGGVKLVPDLVVAETGPGGRDPVLAKALEAIGWTRPVRSPAR